MSNRDGADTPLRILREWVHRLLGAIGRGRSDADLEEELRLHAELAARARNAEPRATTGLRNGATTHAMDALRDQRGLPRAEALASDVLFGLRQMRKHPVASAAAILSLGLAMGATLAALRLVDAVLVRALPVASPERLFVIETVSRTPEGTEDHSEAFDYPTYRDYVSAADTTAHLMVLGLTSPLSIRFDRDGEAEVAQLQFVSGNVFEVLGLQPALGRMLTRTDDVTPGGHAVAVISYDYWTRRFGRDPGVVGRTYAWGSQVFEIVGVGPRRFTGTEPGRVTDLFVPAAMNVQALNNPGWSWFRIWVRPADGIAPAQVQERLQARLTQRQRERLKGFAPNTPRERIDAHLAEKLLLNPAGSGVSTAQKTFRRPLFILITLATLVLLVACANVANLMLAQAMARSREMALRLSIGATRGRLIQMVLVESVLLATAASAAGALFAMLAAPFIVSMLAPPDRPLRLILDVDWRAVASGSAITLAVAALFGLAPALRASGVRPLGVLKGGGQRSRRGGQLLIAVQTAFCVFLLFAAGLFVSTFDRLSHAPLGFTPQNVVLLQTEAGTDRSPAVWTQLADQLRQVSGVEAVSVAGWAPLSGNRWRSTVHAGNRPAPATSPYFVQIGLRYFETMRIEQRGGRDFQPGDVPPALDPVRGIVAGVGIVNESFARAYFDGRDPVGQVVQVRQSRDAEAPMTIVGVVRDVVYDNVREPMRPTVYVPLEDRDGAALLVRMAGDARAAVPQLRREVSRAGAGLSVRRVEHLSVLVLQQMIRERLLAALSGFFAAVALALSAVGLYGTLNYGVVRQRKEIGIRMALGARAAHVVTRITRRPLALVAAGALMGLAGGVMFARSLEAILFEVKPTDPASLVRPLLLIGSAAVLAAALPALRAARIDPARTLRMD